ncbi:MAG: hypothetical protein ACPGVK_09380 [Halocynthiibacter sp.]
MKQFIITTTLLCSLVGSTAVASNVERACLRSDRKAANRNLCGCIQDAADLTLSKSDQRKAAVFFKDPAKAQEVRQSDNRSNERFWKRYKEFATTAEVYCAGM